MLIALFPTIKESLPVRRTIEWSTFVADLGAHAFTFEAKNDVPAFSPAEYPEGSRRAKSRVLRVHFGVLDLDKLTEDQISDVIARATNIESVFYTTWSHPRKPWCARLLVALSRPVLVSEWPTFWTRLNHRFGGHADPQCRDPSRVYFIPAAPAGTEAEAVYHHTAGTPINVDEILATPIPAQEVVRAEIVRKEDLETLAQQWKRKQNSFHKQMGRKLSQTLSGEPFAEEGERDDAIFQLTGLLVEQYPEASAKALAVFFGPSIQRMTSLSLSCPTLEEVEAKIERHQESQLEENAEHEQRQLTERSAQIQEAFSNGRSHPYTEDELCQFADDLNIPRDRMQRRWVIQKNRSFYLYFNGTYLPPTSDADVMLAALRDLAPASSDGVELFKIDLRGNLQLKNPSELSRDFGTQAASVVVSLTAQRATFQAITRTFVEAPCPLRILAPTYDPEVDEWPPTALFSGAFAAS